MSAEPFPGEARVTVMENPRGLSRAAGSAGEQGGKAGRGGWKLAAAGGDVGWEGAMGEGQSLSSGVGCPLNPSFGLCSKDPELMQEKRKEAAQPRLGQRQGPQLGARGGVCRSRPAGQCPAVTVFH